MNTTTPEPLDAARETWPCADCGHKHYASQECPDHSWTDSCPYEGLDCPEGAGGPVARVLGRMFGNREEQK